jgi:hypothetical protein
MEACVRFMENSIVAQCNPRLDVGNIRQLLTDNFPANI